jgi:hypothetical protein
MPCVRQDGCAGAGVKASAPSLTGALAGGVPQWHGSFMSALNAAVCITNASISRAESIELGSKLQRGLDARTKGLSEKQNAADLHKAVAAFHRELAPIVEALLEAAANVVREVRIALRVEETTRFDRRWWQLALLSLHGEAELLETTCGRIRRDARRISRRHGLRAALWLDAWEKTYAGVLDDIDDISETIALGLNPETRAELEALAREALDFAAHEA